MSTSSQDIIEQSLLSNINLTQSIPNKNHKQKKPKKVSLKKGQWSLQEDRLLEQWVKINGPKNWEDCGRFIKGRKGKQCREHWNNCLNPELKKGNWGPEEDFLIMFFYEKCNGSWKKIIPLFNGRIENSIKNRFYSQLRKYATKNMSAKDRKKIIAKIKLNELKNYLNEALIEARNVLLKKTKMSQEEFNLFLNKNEQKIKDNISSTDLETDNNEAEANLSTNLGGSVFEEDSYKTSLNHKRKRTEEEFNNNSKNFQDEFLESSPDNKVNLEGFFDYTGINLDEDKSDIFYNDFSSNDHGIINNNIPFNDIENNNYYRDELTIDCFELDKNNNSLKNIFKEYEFTPKFGIDNFVINDANIIDRKNFDYAFNNSILKED